MQIEKSGANTLTITGNIKTIEDSLQIKDHINSLVKQGSQTINLSIKDSLSMTSTVIGFLMKLVNREKVALSITVGDNRLFTLLEELSLIQQFNVRQGGR